jgi:hypothetical protein
MNFDPQIPPTYSSHYGPPPVVPNRKPVWAALGVGCLVLFLVSLVVGVFAWSRFVQYGIGTDLVEYRASISSSNLPARDKSGLIVQIDRLRTRVSGGKVPGFFRWLVHDEAIEKITADGEISRAELSALKGELEQIEAELR